MSDNDTGKQLKAIYKALYKAFGPQHWWPGDTPFEMMVGAVLTQNTAWSNVEKAIANLKHERLLTPRRLKDVLHGKLASLIRPSGYYNIKAKRLGHLVSFITNHYNGNLKKLFATDVDTLRRDLLHVNGIGPETADSIILYAAEKPVFVVDAYTKRIFSRHGFVPENVAYHEAQKVFIDHLPLNVRMYNEYHALIVRLGKDYCKKSKPRCADCPLRPFLAGQETVLR